MALTYKPTTDHGKGFLPLLTRALGRALWVLGAHFQKWPMTVEQARAELQEGLAHANNIGNLDLLSKAGQAALDDWKKSTQMLIDAFGVAENKNPEQLIAEHQTALVNYAQQTWALTALFDIELLGLTENDTDAGKLP